jgi:Pyruvate/2-oxoacid:ferredoxin oxidoreductase delta subunit
MDDIYRRLARRLDELPHGFPATESGVELRILAKIFSPEDARLALELRPIPERADTIAKRLRRPEGEMRATLEAMALKGQIAAFPLHGVRVYVLMPFIVGIYEFQVDRMDAELAEMFEEYAPTLVNTIGGKAPALARVVPVNVPIKARAEVLRYENVRDLLASARSFRLMECLCRKERAALGDPCSHTLETCMAFSPEPGAYDDFPLGGRTITREEAFAVLDRSEQEGLVHCTYNFQHQQMFVCNCCSCCCGFLRGVKEFGAPHLLVRSNYVATVDAEACSACGACTDERCPMDAMTEADGAFRVDDVRCIGCGVCSVVCPTDAIALVPRPLSERTVPPKDIVAWSFRRAVSRSGPFRALAQFGALAWQARRAMRPPG